MPHGKCPYCRKATSGRYVTTTLGRSVRECCACGRRVAEYDLYTHHLFHRRASDEPLLLVIPDLHKIPIPPPPAPPPLTASPASPHASAKEEEEDPFLPTGFITAFSTWSLERTPVLFCGATSFAGHLAELERALECSSDEKDEVDGGPMVSVEHLRAYLQIVEASSILGLDHDIVDHAFRLFKDCCSVICLRSRGVEALATAALVQAIRQAQEPRTLQEISTASNLPQKELGKYMKILGESLQLSQPINSNSIAIHMPRFCNLLQLNKSVQELAVNIGEIVVNKCFCTRRNPISICAAVIYMACQIKDISKTQAEICKVTGLTEPTVRKVYKELLESWNKAFPMATINTAPSWAPKVDSAVGYHLNTHQDNIAYGHSLTSTHTMDLNQPAFWQPHIIFGKPLSMSGEANKQDGDRCNDLT